MATILIIDRDAVLRSFIADILTRAGHAVEQAWDGADGLQCLRSKPVDLVVTDFGAPGRQGATEIAAIRSEFPALEIIAISAAPHSTGYLRLAATLGGRRTVANPFMSRQLLALVHEMFAGVAAYTAHAEYLATREALSGAN